MKTLYEVAENPSGWDSYSNYIGETPSKDWLVLLCQTRDSELLTTCNWETALETLGGESESVEIFRFGHWACGWLEYICVKKGSDAEKKALEIEQSLEDYCILDEDSYSEAEYNQANEVWQDCYNEKERIEYIRENRSQFEFNCLEDMLSCVRGKYFAGYASELLY